MRTIRIGSGAGYSGDRIEPAVELAEKGDIQYLVFECLGERTVALAQQARMKNPDSGYDPLLEERMRAVLPVCASQGIRIVTNMGAANPLAAARKTAEIARSLGLSSLKIAAIVGDDVLDACKERDLPIMEFDGTIKQLGNRLLSANAYLGAEPIAEALSAGADIVITGRASDPALFLAPMIHAFGWAMDDWNLLGQGTVAGHLLECAGQITGGYFADPGYKDIPDLARLGFPIGEVGEDGGLVITKVKGSGGAVTAQTCKEQLLYEVHDPTQYIQPDVVADFSQVKVEEIAPNRVRVSGGRGTKRTGTLKVSVGYVDSYIGEGQISYAGPGALARGRLALEIVRERLKLTGVAASELWFELIGVDSLHGANLAAKANEPYEVRVRVTGRTENLREAVRIGNEVETLYTNGPAAGGGAVGVERFDLVADSDSFAQIFGAAGDAHADLVRLAGARGDLSPVQRVDADQLEPPVAGGDAGEFQPLANDFQRQPPPRQCAGAGIGNLALADIAVDVANRDLQRAGTFCSPSAADPHAVRRDLLDLHLRKIRDHVGLDILRGIVHLVEQLLLAGLRRHRAAGAFDLGDDQAAVFADFADRKAEPREIGNVLVAGVGEVAAGDLAGAFKQMSGDGALPQQVPVIHRPAEGVNHRRQKQRGIGGAPGDHDIGAAGERLRDRLGAEIGIGRQ